jgi:hypothetical protein
VREPESRVAVVAPRSASSAAVVVGVVFVVAVALLLLFGATLLVAGREQAVAAPPVVVAPPPPPPPPPRAGRAVKVRDGETVLLFDGAVRRAIVFDRQDGTPELHVYQPDAAGRLVEQGWGSSSHPTGSDETTILAHPFRLGWAPTGRGEGLIYTPTGVTVSVTSEPPVGLDPADPRFEYR